MPDVVTIPAEAGCLTRRMSSATPAARTGRPVALVTGATAGIGLQFATTLAERGHDLVLVARDEARLQALAADLHHSHGADCEVVVADLTEREALRRVERRLADLDHPVDLLVNNAGFGLRERFLDNDVEAEQAMLDVLVVAVLRLSHAALGSMTARGRGGIINVSSVAAFLPRGTYGAAKSWVNSFSEWAAAEYAPRGVTVTALCPGFTRTEFHQRMEVQPGTGMMWLEVGRLVDDALADHARGRVYSVPSPQYKVAVALARVVPNRALQRLQSLGRR